MRFAFIARHRHIWPVVWLCEALDVSRSGFNAWLGRAPSRRSREDEEIGAKVRASFIASARTYGARRVWRDVLAEGIDCGLHRIERQFLQRRHAARHLADHRAVQSGGVPDVGLPLVILRHRRCTGCRQPARDCAFHRALLGGGLVDLPHRMAHPAVTARTAEPHLPRNEPSKRSGHRSCQCGPKPPSER